MPKVSLVPWSLALLVCVFAGCRQGDIIEPPDMKAPVRLGEVSVQTVEALAITTGTLKAIEKATLLTENEGRLLMGKNAEGERLDEGDEVEKDQVIAELKNPSLVASTALAARKEEIDNAKKALERGNKSAEQGNLPISELDALRSSRINAQYAYDSALAQLAKLKVHSPLSGRIVRMAEIVDGDHVAPSTEIATVMSYKTILAEVDVANPDYPFVALGQEARVTNFAFKDQVFKGYVSSISPVADEATRAFKAEIEIENPSEELRPGMYIQAEIVVAQHEEALVVPPELVITRNNLPVVFVVEDEKAVAREVEVGIESRDGVEILRGISADDALIVEGYETLRDGTPVRVTR